MVLVSASNLKSVGELICVVFLFLFVLFLAYLAARLAGSFQSGVIQKRSNIHVVEVFHLSGSKMIEIIRVGDRYLVLAVCKDSVTLLTELKETEIKEQETALEPIDFSRILDRLKKNEKQKKTK